MKRSFKEILISLPIESDSNRKFMHGISLYARIHRTWNVHFVDSRDFARNSLAIDVQRYDAMFVREDVIPALARELGTKLPPCVVFGWPSNGRPLPNVEYFSVDGRKIGNNAAEYFLNLGKFASYGFYTEPLDLSFVHERRDGFSAALAKRRLSADACPCYGDTDGVIRWLAGLPKPAAVFCSNIHYAIEVIEACQRGGLNIPRQVSVLGVDDDDILGGFSNPRPSVIALDYARLGFEAAKSIDHRLRTRKCHKTVCRYLTLMRVAEYDTTAPLAPATHLVHNAMAFIRENACQSVSVAEVANHLGVSRKLLGLRFREICNDTVINYIQKIKLEKVQSLLMTSAKAIGAISEECGFRNQAHLKSLFKQRFGVTMSDFRRQSQSLK